MSTEANCSYQDSFSSIPNFALQGKSILVTDRFRGEEQDRPRGPRCSKRSEKTRAGWGPRPPKRHRLPPSSWALYCIYNLPFVGFQGTLYSHQG